MSSRLPSRRAGALLGIAFLSCAEGLAAEAGPCDRYAVHRILTGMKLRQVEKVMGVRPTTVELSPGPSGPASTMTFRTGAGATVVVRFDRDAERVPSAKVVAVRARIGASVDPAEFAHTLLAMYGEPASGREHLEAALRSGSAVWREDECDAEVVASLGIADWWDPAAGRLEIELRSRRYLETREAWESGGMEIAAAENARAGEAAAEPASAPPEEPPVAAAAATAAMPVPGASPLPRRPLAFRGTKLSARVLVRVSVKSDGSVSDVVALECDRPGLGFEELAVDAVRGWRFDAATENGRPVDSIAEVWVDFR